MFRQMNTLVESNDEKDTQIQSLKDALEDIQKNHDHNIANKGMQTLQTDNTLLYSLKVESPKTYLCMWYLVNIYSRFSSNS